MKRKIPLNKMRESCGVTINELAEKNKKIVHVTTDGSISKDFLKKFPHRHFDVGIAESNAIGIAAGLASKGKQVVINAITSFIIPNAYLQIRNLLCFSKLNVVILGVGSGLSYGALGYTHHSLEDIALMKTLPGMKIYLPADAKEAQGALIDAIKRRGPSFIRLETGNKLNIRNNNGKIYFDKPIVLSHGKDILILSYGGLIETALNVAKILRNKRLGSTVVKLNSLNIYPLKCLLPIIKNHKLIISLEEHYVNTGVGSSIANLLMRNKKNKIAFVTIGVKNEFCQFAGSRLELLKYYGLDANSVANKILNNLKK